jgi:uncharacterized protein DUF4126
MLKWTLAIIAGGGAAGLMQSVTVLARTHSAALTAGLGNPIVATGELAAAIIMSLISLMTPFVALALIALICLIAYRLLRTKTHPAPPA